MDIWGQCRHFCLGSRLFCRSTRLSCQDMGLSVKCLWMAISWNGYFFISTAWCIWSVIPAISNVNRCSNSLGLLCHVSFKKDQGDWDWRLRLNNTPNAIGCSLKVDSLFESQYIPETEMSVVYRKRVQYTHAQALKLESGLFRWWHRADVSGSFRHEEVLVQAQIKSPKYTQTRTHTHK